MRYAVAARQFAAIATGKTPPAQPLDSILAHSTPHPCAYGLADACGDACRATGGPAHSSRPARPAGHLELRDDDAARAAEGAGAEAGVHQSRGRSVRARGACARPRGFAAARAEAERR